MSHIVPSADSPLMPTEFVSPPPLSAKRARRIREQDERSELPTLRQRKCNMRLTLPNAAGDGESVFTCNLLASHTNGGGQPPHHAESGRVRAKDGRVRTYRILWSDADTEVWRQQ